MKSKILYPQLVALLIMVLILAACSSESTTITIDAPDVPADLLTKGAGSNFAYYALAESPPQNWEDVSKGTLWICNLKERPPLIPQNIANMIDGGGFLAGTVINLKWKDQKGVLPSSALEINKIQIAYGLIYESCTESVVEKMEEGQNILLLTDIKGDFKGKDKLVVVKFY